MSTLATAFAKPSSTFSMRVLAPWIPPGRGLAHVVAPESLMRVLVLENDFAF
jgi:hypothetical protein